MATVIRIIKYEGEEAAVRNAIQLSKAMGVHSFPGNHLTGGSWSMTIAEHYNDLPELVELTDNEVDKALLEQEKAK